MAEQTQSIGWIGTSGSSPRCSDSPEVVYFRKKFHIPEIPETFLIEITADARYKLLINGKLVNAGPQKGDTQIWYKDTLDLGEYLKPGDNIIVAIVLTIPDRQNGGNYSFARTRTPGLYLKGSSLIADASWRWKRAPVRIIAEDMHFSPLYIFEQAAGSGLNHGIYEEGYDDSHWEEAIVYDPFSLTDRLRPENLQARTIPLMRLESRRFTGLQCIRQSAIMPDRWDQLFQEGTSLEIPAHRREVVEISAGEETTGYLRLLMAGGAAAKITILTSECYAYEPIEGLGGPIIPRKGDRTDSTHGKLYGHTDTYQVEGAGTSASPEAYEPFWFRTFRYVKLTIETGNSPLQLRDVSYTKNTYPLDVRTTVHTSDPSLEKVWDISERTLRLCMHETYEDCPFYEQLQYAMDTRSQILYTYAVSADDRLARQAMDDFRRSQRYDGMINCSYPNYENHVIPGFGIFYIAMVHDHMMYFGDEGLVRDHLPAILGVLNFFRNNLDGTGLVGKVGGPLFSSRFWSFIDWTSQWRDSFGVPPATETGPITMESLYFIMALQQAAGLADFLGFGEMACRMSDEAAAIQAAVNRLCRGKDGMYTDGPGVHQYSQHTQVFAILTKTVDADTGRRYLLETLDHQDDYAQCSVAMMFYLFRALEACELYERTAGLWDIWREMVAKNLTTCEEDSVLSRSDCHAWGALALYELPSVILGVRPTAPGFSEMEINPKAGHLSQAAGEVITPRGLVKISWMKDEAGLKVKADIPEGIKIRKPVRS